MNLWKPLDLRSQLRLLLGFVLFFIIAVTAVVLWESRREQSLAPLHSGALAELRAGPRERQAAERLLDIERLRSRTHRTERAALAALFLLALAALALFHAYLERALIRPLVELNTLVLTWVAGRAWPDPSPGDTHEVQNLYYALRFLLDRLSSEMKKARALIDLKGQLVSIISHETNNSLSVITGMLTLLQESDSTPTEKRSGYYKLAQLCIRSLALQSQTLLDMGRLESGKLALRIKPVVVRDLISNCLERLRLLYERKEQELTLDLPAQPLLVQADPDALSLVLMNLLSNAVKYTPERGRISIGVGPDPADPSRARISISDTGIGIPPEDQQRIFSGYFRTQISRSKAEGFGVGLSLAWRILEAHSSDLKVESFPGRGSTFRFSLRRCASAD